MTTQDRRQSLTRLGSMLDTLNTGLSRSKTLRKVQVPHSELPTLPVKFTHEQRYLEGKSTLSRPYDSKMTSNKQHVRELKELLRFSPSKNTVTPGYLSREKLGTAEMKQALKRFRRKFGEGSVLQAKRPGKVQRVEVGVQLFEDTTVCRKQQLDEFIGKYMERRKGWRVGKGSAQVSPQHSPLGSPSHSPSHSPDSHQLRVQLKRLQRQRQCSEDLDFDSDANLLNEIHESTSLLLREQSRIKNFTQAKFRQMRLAGRHLAF